MYESIFVNNTPEGEGIHYYENNEVPRVLKSKYQLEIIIEVRGL